MPATDQSTYTIESLIAELNRLAASRGWGHQMLTNISKITSASGANLATLSTGNEENIENLKDDVKGLEQRVRELESDNEKLEETIHDKCAAIKTFRDRVIELSTEAYDLAEEIEAEERA